MKTVLSYLLLVCLFLISPKINANVGDPDLSFGTNGSLTISVGSLNNIITGVKTDSLGNIIVSGYYDNGSDTDIFVARYDSSGNLDLNFGTNGITTTNIDNKNNYAYALALDTDERILVGGYTDNGTNIDMVLLRYNSIGVLDPSFGDGDGIITTDINNDNDYAYALAIDSTNRIVLAGGTFNGNDYDLAVTCYLYTTGAIDARCDGTGILTKNSGDSDFAYTTTIDSSGNIYAAGYVYNGNDYDIGLLGYDSMGAPNSTWGSGSGLITTDINSHNDSDIARSIVLDGAGNLIVGGYSQNSGANDFTVLSYNISTGALNNSFGTNGVLTQSIGAEDDIGYAAAIDSSDNIVLVGNTYNGINTDFAVMRSTSVGVIDTLFGTSGIVTTAFSGSAYDDAYAVTLDADDNILVAGLSDTFGALIRYSGTNCGNGIVEGSEVCDDSNSINGDSCDSNCTIPTCGNGAISPAEECDDRNLNDNDGCSALCLKETLWFSDTDGDLYGSTIDYQYALAQPTGYITTGDDCDDSNINVNPGETESIDQCEDSIDQDCNGIDLACPPPVVCGNGGDPETGEECDDGNTTNGDSCSSTCTDETKWYADSDGDGYGDESSSIWATTQPNGYTLNKTDCDDTSATVNPGETESASECGDQIDQDCSGSDLRCSATPENCDNKIDDDSDGETDCNDNDCSDDSACVTITDIQPKYKPLIGCSLNKYTSSPSPDISKISILLLSILLFWFKKRSLV